MEFDLIVIGGGVAGLGVAISAAMDYNKKVLVYEKNEWKADDPVPPRYHQGWAASYKNAGMCHIMHNQDRIDDTFQRLSTEQMKKLGVPLRPGGMTILTDSDLEKKFISLVEDRKVRDWDAFLAQKEPFLNYKNLQGIFHDPDALRADPEVTMKVLFGKCNELGVKILYGEHITGINHSTKDKNGHWLVKTDKGAHTARDLCIAAGPATVALMKSHFHLHVPMKNVLGLITEFEKVDDSMPDLLNGLVMGGKSLVAWGTRMVLLGAVGKDSLDITRVQNKSDRRTTHLYMAEHDHRIVVGGPRILIPDNYTDADLDVKQYRKDTDNVLAYAKKLVDMSNYKEKGTWSGVMAFPTDETPYVGPVGHGHPNLYMSTGWASAGFRECLGAGVWLAKVIYEKGGVPSDDPNDPEDKNMKNVLPGNRLRSTINITCC